MPTVIDALIMTLGLDPTGQFGKDSRRVREESKRTKDQLDRDAKSATENQKRFTSGLKDAKEAAVALGVVLTAGVGIKDFITHTVTATAAAGRLAPNLNMGVDALTAWQQVAKQVTTNADDATASLQALQGIQNNWRFNGQQNGALIALGMSPQDLDDKTTFLLKLADKFSKMKDSDASYYGSLLGITPGMVQVLEKGRAGLESMYSTQLKNAAATRKQADDMQAFQQSVIKMEQDVSSLGRDLLTKFLPALQTIARVLDDATLKHPAMVEGLMGLGAVLTTLSALSLPVWLLRLLGIGGGGAAVAGVEAGLGGAAAGGAIISGAGGAVAGGAIVAGAGVAGLAYLYNNYRFPIDQANKASDGALAQRDAFLKKQIAALRAPGQSPAQQRANLNVIPQLLADEAKVQAEISRRQTRTVNGSSGGNGSLADRNNNPGNLTDPATGRFRTFATRQEGFTAMARQLWKDFAVYGQKTVAQIINDPRHGWSNQWAPGNSAASTGAYISRVSRSLGVDPNAQINLADPAVMQRLILAMAAVERGGSGGRPAPGAQTTVNVNGPITVNTAAKDLTGTAAAFAAALARSTYVAQADGGPS